MWKYKKIKAKKTAPQWLLRMEEVAFKYSNLRRECKIKWEGAFFFLQSEKQCVPSLCLWTAHGNNQNQVLKVEKQLILQLFFFWVVEHAPHLFTAARLLHTNTNSSPPANADKVKHHVQTALWQMSHTP